MLDFPAPDGAATRNRVPRTGPGIRDSGFGVREFKRPPPKGAPAVAQPSCPNPQSPIPNPGYSMFCTCSRIWSISTFNSTAMLLVRASTDFEPRVLASRLNSCSRKSRRSEEHTSELQSLMRISYAVFGLKKKKTTQQLET